MGGASRNRGVRLAEFLDEKAYEFVASRGDGDYHIHARDRMTEIYFTDSGGKRRSVGAWYGPDHRRDAVIVIRALVDFHGLQE